MGQTCAVLALKDIRATCWPLFGAFLSGYIRTGSLSGLFLIGYAQFKIGVKMLLCGEGNLSPEFLRLGAQLAPFWGIFGSNMCSFGLETYEGNFLARFGFIFQTIG